MAAYPGIVGSLPGQSFEGLVIDNDMFGNVQRLLRGIEVTDETLSYEVIGERVHGNGHYLGHPQTPELMQTEYLYPKVADRRIRERFPIRLAPEDMRPGNGRW